MKINFGNVDFRSNSGPNNFAKKLRNYLVSAGHEIDVINPDIQICFIEKHSHFKKNVLRLDGIYFSTRGDWKKQNYKIRQSYDECDYVIVQSHFNKALTEKYFGKRENVEVISNGAPSEIISKIDPASLPIKNYGKVWFSASSWRPHKRLSQNIEVFKKFSKKNDIMLVAGSNPDSKIDAAENVYYVGNLSWKEMISVMKLADNFIHTAWLDHCPNVVVDAKVSGCKLYCSSAGGTKELASSGDVIFKEKDWDFSPLDLYDPPAIQLDDFYLSEKSIDYSMAECGKKYEKVFRKAVAI